MFFRSELLTLLKTKQTSHLAAWKDAYYETYRLNIELPCGSSA